MPALVIGNKSQGQLVAGLQLAGIDLRADLGQVAMGIRRGDSAAHEGREERIALLHGHRVVAQIAGGARHRGALGRALASRAGRRRRHRPQGGQHEAAVRRALETIAVEATEVSVVAGFKRGRRAPGGRVSAREEGTAAR